MVVVVWKRAITGGQVAGGRRGIEGGSLCVLVNCFGGGGGVLRKAQSQETDVNSLLRENITESSPALGRA